MPTLLQLLQIVERRARYAIGLSALMLLMIMMAFNTGLIATSPSYNLQSWYLINTGDTYVVTTEYADETACRRQEKSAKNCRSGAAMMARALAEQKPTSRS